MELGKAILTNVKAILTNGTCKSYLGNRNRECNEIHIDIFFLYKMKLSLSTNLAVDGTVHLIDTGNHLMTICQHCYKIVNARMSSSSIYHIYEDIDHQLMAKHASQGPKIAG